MRVCQAHVSPCVPRLPFGREMKARESTFSSLPGEMPSRNGQAHCGGSRARESGLAIVRLPSP